MSTLIYSRSSMCLVATTVSAVTYYDTRFETASLKGHIYLIQEQHNCRCF